MPYSGARMKDDKGKPLVQHPVAASTATTRRPWPAGDAARGSSRASRRSRPSRASPTTTPIATPAARRCAPSSAASATWSTTSRGRKIVTYPWTNGLKADEIEAYYDKEGFNDWVHAETGAQVLKAQHPEFELWTQGVHSRGGVSCADCHMPYVRAAPQGERPLGAQPAAQPEPRLPDLPRRIGEGDAGARAQYPGAPPRAHAAGGQGHHGHARHDRGREEAAGHGGGSPAAAALQRKAQWRLDFVAAENTMGFHAPQEPARILGEVIDHARQGQLEAERATRKP